MIRHVLIWLSGLIFFSYSGIESGNAQTNTSANDSTETSVSPFSSPRHAFLRDTLYVLDSVYLEVRIDKQTVYQYFRNGTVKRYPCSTGNRRLKDGIATREGIFSVQWKSKRYMSRQFEVWLNYWMPFDGGIGFHGLDGRSYYRHLGRRPSSHGCVRISNETGRAIFPTVSRGTLVYVHKGMPARLLVFGDPSDSSLRVITNDDKELLATRLDAVHQRRADATALQERLALTSGKKTFRKIPVGMAKGIAPVQYRVEPTELPLMNEELQPLQTYRYQRYHTLREYIPSNDSTNTDNG